MKKRIVPALLLLVLTACNLSRPGLPAAATQTQAAWTQAPTQTAYPTYTAFPTYTPVPTRVITKIFVWTPTVSASDSSCQPITQMHYTDRSKMLVDLQAYVANLNGVKSVSYVIPEKLYSNSNSELFHVTYISSEDDKVYSKRYIVYTEEFDWKKGVFSIDGQCWIDPPH
jgi:hypothetical protein